MSVQRCRNDKKSEICVVDGGVGRKRGKVTKVSKVLFPWEIPWTIHKFDSHGLSLSSHFTQNQRYQEVGNFCSPPPTSISLHMYPSTYPPICLSIYTHLFVYPYIYLPTYLSLSMYIHTGCLVGLGTFPEGLVGLGTLFTTTRRFWAKTPIVAVFSTSLVCVCVELLFLFVMFYFCMQSRISSSLSSNPFLSRCLRFLVEMPILIVFGGLIGQASMCSNLSILGPFASCFA